MSNKLILCQGCIHREVCGHEGVDDPALTFCDDYLPINGCMSVEDKLPDDKVWVKVFGTWIPLPEAPQEVQDDAKWVDDESLENEDMRPDNEFIGGW